MIIISDKNVIIWTLVVIPAAWLIQHFGLLLLDKIVHRHWTPVKEKQVSISLGWPLFSILVLIAWQSIFSNFNIYQSQETIVHFFERIYIFAVIWFLIQFVNLIKAIFTAKFKTTNPDNLQARKIQTQFQFLGKSANIVLVVIGLALLLMTFESVRRIGSSLIASAGLAGIIIGFAAQRSLGTFLSGFQVAFTQPIRMDDVVVVEGEWGQIEEITLTYVVIRIWDQRRLIVPISYFTEKPFQNWTRSQSELLSYVFINFDFSLSVDSIRDEFLTILNSTPLWDKRVSVLQVTDCTEKTIQVRFLMSARNSPDSFDLRCLVREKMVAYIQRTNPSVFPVLRLDDKVTSLARESHWPREEPTTQEISLQPQLPESTPPHPQRS